MYSSSKRLLGRALAVLTLLAAISSCDDPLVPRRGERIGVIAFFGDPVVVTVPDTVLAGESFSASVRTYGGGCISQGNTEVESAGLSIDITPHDVHSGARICEDILNLFDHTVALTVSQPGTVQVRFHGRQLPGDVPVTEIRQVVVK